MNNDDLGKLFKQWRDIEPRADFQANVWRRIRLAEAAQTAAPERLSLAEWLAWRPAWAVAAAVVVSAILGSSAGVLSARRGASPFHGETQFLSGGTLAGGYVKLASNPARPRWEGGR